MVPSVIALLDAAKDGDAERCEHLLSQGIGVDATDPVVSKQLQLIFLTCNPDEC